MRTADFDYNLPEELIAQTPVEPRDHSRLMVVHRGDGTREHKHFYDRPVSLLKSMDLPTLGLPTMATRGFAMMITPSK